MVDTPEKIFRKDLYFEQTGYYPHDGQLVIHNDPTRFRVLCNGRRWGKTLLGAKEAEATAYVMNRLGQPMTGWIVGPEYTDCEKEFRVIYDSLKALGVDMVSSKFLNNVDNGNMHIKTKWGWDLQCRSAHHPETLVGEGLDFVLLVEAGRQKRRTWTEYIRPTLSDKRGTALFSGVPEGASSTSLLYALWRRGLDPTKRQWKSWRMPSWTNNVVFPGGRNDPEILDAEDDLTEDEFRRQYGAEFVERVGRVMAEWEDEIHLRPLSYNPNWPLYGAVDYGYTNDWVWLWIQVDPFENVYVLEEIRRKHMDTEEIAKQVLLRHPLVDKLVAFYPDPHSPDDTNILARHLRVSPRLNTDSEIRTRNAAIRRLLKPMPEHAEPENQQARLLFDLTKCPVTTWEMREGYRWPEHQSEVKNDSENPLNKDDHGPEALGRFVTGYFSVTGTGRSSRQSKAKVRR